MSTQLEQQEEEQRQKQTNKQKQLHPVRPTVRGSHHGFQACVVTGKRAHQLDIDPYKSLKKRQC